tara:strand:+ start:834 stop:1442 length:609 start_codon:yes stop_codon:yes gene_type:complete
MASNEHSSLEDSQLHVPKGFSTASNDTVLTKNSSGALQWQDDNLRKTHFVRVSGFLNRVRSADEHAPAYGGNITYSWSAYVTDPTNDAQDALQQAQLYCTRDGFVNSFSGLVGGTSGKTVSFKIYKGTPVDESSAAIDLTQLGDTASEVLGGDTTTDLFSITSLGSSASFAAGDVLIITIAPSTADETTVRFNATMEVVYTS